MFWAMDGGSNNEKDRDDDCGGEGSVDYECSRRRADVVAQPKRRDGAACDCAQIRMLGHLGR